MLEAPIQHMLQPFPQMSQTLGVYPPITISCWICMKTPPLPPNAPLSHACSKFQARAGTALARQVVTAMCKLTSDAATRQAIGGGDGNDNDDLDGRRGGQAASTGTRTPEHRSDSDDSPGACGDGDDGPNDKRVDHQAASAETAASAGSDGCIGAGAARGSLEGPREVPCTSAGSPSPARQGRWDGGEGKGIASGVVSPPLGAAVPPVPVSGSPPAADGSGGEWDEPDPQLRLKQYRLDSIDYYRSVLCMAAAKADLVVAEALLASRESDINEQRDSQCEYEFAAIHWGVYSGQRSGKIIDILARAGADAKRPRNATRRRCTLRPYRETSPRPAPSSGGAPSLASTR